jgi:hypothetical protein
MLLEAMDGLAVQNDGLALVVGLAGEGVLGVGRNGIFDVGHDFEGG